MSSRRRGSRAVARSQWHYLLHVCGSATALLWASPGVAQADGETARCLDAYAEGQRAQKRGTLTKAQEAFAFCGGPMCPQALHADCLRWLDEVAIAIPTSVFKVFDTSGNELQGVQLRVDDGPKQNLDGRAFSFDPGRHELVFEADGYLPVERSFTFSEGEKLVMRQVRLQPSARGSATDSRVDVESPSSGARAERQMAPAWIAAGVGVVGLAGFATFALSARADDRALERCIPDCRESQVDEVEQQYLWANVSLGVGAAGLLGAAAWLLFSPHDSAAPGTTRLEEVSLVFGPTPRIMGRF